MTRSTIFIAAGLALAVALPAAPAQAQATRAFVSAAGSDSNNCINVATPCRHFQTAYNAMPNGGEIDVLDPANYGSLTVTHTLSVVGRGWATLSPVSGSAAITINAGAGDGINISGVTLDGGFLSNTNGILFNSGARLNVRDSVIQNFTQQGIKFVPDSSSMISTTQIFVSNTLVSDNLIEGINIEPTGSGTTHGVLDHVQIEDNGDGLFVSSNTQTINVTVTDSVSANNANMGVGNGGGITVASGGTTVAVMVRNSTIANNNGDGLNASGTGAAIRVTRSTITANFTAWTNSSSGVVLSYADNNIDGNGSANTEPPSALTYR